MMGEFGSKIAPELRPRQAGDETNPGTPTGKKIRRTRPEASMRGSTATPEAFADTVALVSVDADPDSKTERPHKVVPRETTQKAIAAVMAAIPREKIIYYPYINHYVTDNSERNAVAGQAVQELFKQSGFSDHWSLGEFWNLFSFINQNRSTRRLFEDTFPGYSLSEVMNIFKSDDISFIAAHIADIPERFGIRDRVANLTGEQRENDITQPQFKIRSVY